MSIEQKTVKYAKEVDDVMGLVVAIIQNRKDKAKLENLLAPFIAAASGIDQVDDELAADRNAVLTTVGSRLGDIVDALLAKPEAKPADPNPSPVV